MRHYLLFAALLPLLTLAQNLSAQESPDILQVLEDRPFKMRPFPDSRESSPWLTTTEVFDIFNLLLENDDLRYYPDIRERLVILSETHPFTEVRAGAQLALSDYSGESVPLMFRYGRVPEGYIGPTPKDINKSMTYCAPPPNAKRPDFEVKAEADAAHLEASGHDYVRPQYRFQMPMKYGTLLGGFYSIQGIGLTYKEKAAPQKTLSLSRANMRYVMKSDIENEYWLIDGPHHMIGGASISKLVESKDGIKRYLHRVLPSTVDQVFELDDGRLFINFVNLDPSKRSGTIKGDEFTPTPLETYNPPIFIYPDGQVSLACLADAQKY